MSSYVAPLQTSPSTMVTLEGDSVPLQPPHPTMPLYTITETLTPHDALKLRAERHSMKTEWTEQSVGRETYVKYSLVVLTTMEITTKMAGHDPTLHMATLTKASHVMHHHTMPLHTPPSFPHTQHHHNCIATPKALDHTPDNK